ncbi:MAG: phenylacetate--CoA ligase family protein [Kiritimatiellia bacterium]
MTVFDARHETISREQLERLQLERLQALLARLRRHVRRYRESLGEIEIASLADIVKLPFTTPEDLLRSFPYGMFALPLREVIRLHSAVGPDGKQLVVGHTRNDLLNWGRLVARQLFAANVSNHDVVQISLESGVFTGATGYLLGAELLGASVIPEDPMHVEYQLSMLQNYRASVLITSPTNARELLRLLDDRRIDPQALNLVVVILSRPVSQTEREQLRSGLFVDVRCSFGVPEILDPGICLECEAGAFHVNEDHFIVEEDQGELVLTTLCREAMPLLRYRTRIACELRRDKCPCGRTGTILKPGPRLDGQLRVNEETLYPSQIEEVLSHTKARGQPFRIEMAEGSVRIILSVTENIFADTVRTLNDLQESVQVEFLARLGIPAEVRFISPMEFKKK